MTTRSESPVFIEILCSNLSKQAELKFQMNEKMAISKLNQSLNKSLHK